MTTFENTYEAAFELGYSIEKAAKAAGFDIADSGASAQSCSTYLTLQREDDDSETIQTLSVRISDHTARSCISAVDYHVAIGRSDWTADTSLRVEESDDEDCYELSCTDEDFQQVVADVIAAAEAAEWE